MNKEIEEMARYIHANAITHDTQFIEDCRAIAIELHEQDYRKQRVSRWHYDEENECFVCDCGCSALNNYRGLSVNSKFCPHCGAKMEGEEDA